MKNKKNINNELFDLFNLINKSKKKFLIISIVLFCINSAFISKIKPEQIGSISLIPATVAKSKLYETTEHAFKELDLNQLSSESIFPKCKASNFNVSIDEKFIGISYKSREKEEINECLTDAEKYIQNKEYVKFSNAIHIIDEKLDLYKELRAQSVQNKSESLVIERDIAELSMLKKSKFDTHQTQIIGSTKITNNQHYPRLIIIIIVLLLSLILSMIAELFQSYKDSQSISK